MAATGRGVISMSVHLHRARQWTAWTLSGHVTYSGRPLDDTMICLDLRGEHSACGRVQSDGSFRLVNMTCLDPGAFPGRYRAHLFTVAHRPEYPSKYEKPETSDLDLDVAPGWNDFRIDLQ
jgi:hypothetical protein